MAQIPPGKMGALLAKHAQKKAPPPKKPGGGGGPPPPSKHAQEEATHEGDSPEHEQQEHDKNVNVQEIAERVENGDGDEHLMNLMDGYDETDGPPDWAEDEDLWHKATSMVEPHKDDYEDVPAIIAHVYQALGGKIGKAEGDHEDGDEDHENGGGEQHGGGKDHGGGGGNPGGGGFPGKGGGKGQHEANE